jgi:hypothetical protein
MQNTGAHSKRETLREMKELETYEATGDYRFDYAAHRDVGFARNQKEFNEKKRKQLLEQNSNKNKLM